MPGETRPSPWLLARTRSPVSHSLPATERISGLRVKGWTLSVLQHASQGKEKPDEAPPPAMPCRGAGEQSFLAACGGDDWRRQRSENHVNGVELQPDNRSVEVPNWRVHSTPTPPAPSTQQPTAIIRPPYHSASFISRARPQIVWNRAGAGAGVESNRVKCARTLWSRWWAQDETGELYDCGPCGVSRAGLRLTPTPAVRPFPASCPLSLGVV